MLRSYIPKNFIIYLLSLHYFSFATTYWPICLGEPFMNKVFKIIWNKTTQSFVVTSELAKGAVKALQTPNNV